MLGCLLGLIAFFTPRIVIVLLLLTSDWVQSCFRAFSSPFNGLLVPILALIFLPYTLLAYCLAGWSFRLMVFGHVYAWDLLTLRRLRFSPAPNGNWAFTAAEIDGVPIRTYGKLMRSEQGELSLVFRPWLVLPQRSLPLPKEGLVVGRGLIYPEILRLEPAAGETRSWLILPPRYRTHEEVLAGVYRFAEVRDVGLLRGLKAGWAWLKRLSGFGRSRSAVPMAAA